MNTRLRKRGIAGLDAHYPITVLGLSNDCSKPETSRSLVEAVRRAWTPVLVRETFEDCPRGRSSKMDSVRTLWSSAPRPVPTEPPHKKRQRNTRRAVLPTMQNDLATNFSRKSMMRTHQREDIARQDRGLPSGIVSKDFLRSIDSDLGSRCP